MVDLEDIRAIATPQSLARYILGSPMKERKNELWYKSPFREETEPSFEVSERGFHDFGSGEHLDIFSFVQRVRHCSFIESVNILASIYGIADRDYESNKLKDWCKKQREEQEEYHKMLNWFYFRVWEEVDKEYKDNSECLRIYTPDKYVSTYKILIDQRVKILGMEEYLAENCNTWKDKEELMKKAVKGELPTWLINRLKATMTLWDLNIKLRQRREY